MRILRLPLPVGPFPGDPDEHAYRCGLCEEVVLASEGLRAHLEGRHPHARLKGAYFYRAVAVAATRAEARRLVEGVPTGVICFATGEDWRV